MINLIIQLISGAAGGNIIGGLLKQFSLGPIGNTIAGVIGGGVGGQILAAVMGGGGLATGAATAVTAAAGSGMDIGSIISQIAGGGVGGGVLMAIVGVIRQKMGGTPNA